MKGEVGIVKRARILRDPVAPITGHLREKQPANQGV
jgi:hypothetical protein